MGLLVSTRAIAAQGFRHFMLKQTEERESQSDRGTLDVAPGTDHLTIRFAGRWDVQTIMAREHSIAEILPDPGTNTVIDLSAVTMLDTIGAMGLLRLRDRLAERGKVEILGASPAQTTLLDQVGHAVAEPLLRPPKLTLVDRIAALGARTIEIGKEAGRLIGFYGELVVVTVRLARNPRSLRLTSTVNHMQKVGLEAMPIVGLLAFLVGVVLTFISGDQLARFGASIFIVNLIGLGVLRELGILITAIIIAGRSGSAFTAEIGTMKINQEVDAMRTIGLDPMEILVVPRTVALILILIPLVFFADMVMIGGGALMADLSLGITIPQFIDQFQSSVAIINFWVGMAKTPVFAFVIAIVGCFHGLEVSGSAESVGQHTTQSVVQSIFLVIVFDAIFAIIFNALGW
jgi:phospholipid/cholesterol/gamma-HCH transport system permease protein